MALAFIEQIDDLRSSVVREACGTISAVASAFGGEAGPLFSLLLPRLVEVSAGANSTIAAFANACVISVLEHAQLPRALSGLLSVLDGSRSKAVHACTAEYIALILDRWDAACLDQHIPAIRTALVALIGDASPEARKSARVGFAALARRWPRHAKRALVLVDFRQRQRLERILASTERRASAAAPGRAARPPGALSPASPTIDTHHLPLQSGGSGGAGERPLRQRHEHTLGPGRAGVDGSQQQQRRRRRLRRERTERGAGLRFRPGTRAETATPGGRLSESMREPRQGARRSFGEAVGQLSLSIDASIVDSDSDSVAGDGSAGSGVASDATGPEMGGAASVGTRAGVADDAVSVVTDVPPTSAVPSSRSRLRARADPRRIRPGGPVDRRALRSQRRARETSARAIAQGLGHIGTPPRGLDATHAPAPPSPRGDRFSRLPGVGDVVAVALTRGSESAKVRFVGHTQFAPGVWFGLELASPLGKNDGSVQGVRYFRCRPDHGLFVRPAKLGASAAPLSDLSPARASPSAHQPVQAVARGEAARGVRAAAAGVVACVAVQRWRALLEGDGSERANDATLAEAVEGAAKAWTGSRVEEPQFLHAARPIAATAHAVVAAAEAEAEALQSPVRSAWGAAAPTAQGSELAGAAAATRTREMRSLRAEVRAAATRGEIDTARATAAAGSTDLPAALAAALAAVRRRRAELDRVEAALVAAFEESRRR